MKKGRKGKGIKETVCLRAKGVSRSPHGLALVHNLSWKEGTTFKSRQEPHKQSGSAGFFGVHVLNFSSDHGRQRELPRPCRLIAKKAELGRASLYCMRRVLKVGGVPWTKFGKVEESCSVRAHGAVCSTSNVRQAHYALPLAAWPGGLACS